MRQTRKTLMPNAGGELLPKAGAEQTLEGVGSSAGLCPAAPQSPLMGLHTDPMVWTPVTFPPGRARLATSPLSSIEPPPATTMGSVVVTCLAISPVVVFCTTSTLTGSWTNSAARAANRSRLPSAQRHSMAMVLPSTHPRSRSPSRNASSKSEGTAADGGKFSPRNAIRGTCPGCWAMAVSGSPRAVRTRTIMVRSTTPRAMEHLIGLLLSKPNAGRLARLKAGARHERAL
jgi:hypothetical protein